jgi:hypothetical protein
MSDIPPSAEPNVSSSTVWVKRSAAVEATSEGVFVTSRGAPATAPSTTTFDNGPDKSVSNNGAENNASPKSAVNSIESVSSGSNIIQLGTLDSHPGVEIGTIESVRNNFEKQKSNQVCCFSL